MMRQTSMDAYHSIKVELNARQQQVLDQLSVSGSCSNEKLSKLLKLPINQITPRVLELRKRGLVKEMWREPSETSGRMCTVWGVVHG
tara:strand:+ start:260 stop:520 length:261 start_codon:yes stop_codon:yes gene_type:complete